MSDEIDLAQEREQITRDDAIRANCTYELPPGVEGDCDMCGEWSGRLIGGACASCRDKYALP
jgi:hypothetical protein